MFKLENAEFDIPSLMLLFSLTQGRFDPTLMTFARQTPISRLKSGMVSNSKFVGETPAEKEKIIKS